MNKIKAGLVAAAILMSFSGAALAEGGSFYGAVDVGQATSKDGCTGLPAGFTLLSCSDTATALRGTLGYQVNPSFGLEASYGDYGTMNANVKYLGVPITASASASGFQFSALGSLPVSDVLALTGKLGIAFTEAESSVSCAGCSTFSTSASNTTVSTLNRNVPCSAK